MDKIEYFYCAHSGYAWIGSARFYEIAAAAGREIDHRPIDLHRVMEATALSAFGDLPPARIAYFFRHEMRRWAEFRGVEILDGRPSTHDSPYHLANGMLIAADRAGQDVGALAHRMLEAHWRDDQDLGDTDALDAMAADAGLDGPALREAAATPAVQNAYTANTAEAIERSVFGSPTYFWRGDMFYGQDRLELLERALQKPFESPWPRDL